MSFGDVQISIMKGVSKELYPFEGSFLEIGGVRMHYLDEGEGPPVVCVHGNPTWSFYYRNLVTALRNRHRVIVPDHIGCGFSDVPDDELYDYTLSRRIEDLETLIESLQVGPVDLVVHDWGGAIGIGWAVRHPEKLRRLVILNTGAFHLPEDKTLPWQLWFVRNTPLGAALVRGGNAFARGATWMAVTKKRLSKAERDAYCAPYHDWQSRLATLRFVQDIPLAPGDPAYDTVSAIEAALPELDRHPVMICWGLKDFVFDHHFLSAFREAFPNAEVHEFPDCGHYVLEDAAEEIIPLVKRFLE
jgi:haloalkane dehalogenase